MDGSFIFHSLGDNQDGNVRDESLQVWLVIKMSLDFFIGI